MIVDCGEGSQTVQWLTDVALMLYDPDCMMVTGESKGARHGTTTIGLTDIIKSTLKDGDEIRVLLVEDIPEPKPTKRK